MTWVGRISWNKPPCSLAEILIVFMRGNLLCSLLLLHVLWFVYIFQLVPPLATSNEQLVTHNKAIKMWVSFFTPSPLPFFNRCQSRFWLPNSFLILVIILMVLSYLWLFVCSPFTSPQIELQQRGCLFCVGMYACVWRLLVVCGGWVCWLPKEKIRYPLNRKLFHLNTNRKSQLFEKL